MKRLLTTGAALLLALSMTAGYIPFAAAADSTISFDFEQGDSGFAPIYADYPNTEGVEKFYEFQHGYSKVPVDGAGNGIFISGNNHSDDLFMGYVKALEGFVPARTYQFKVSFKLATNVDGGMIGVGGSPGASVYVKCGIAPIEPKAVLDVTDGYYRLNIDKANQSQSGKDMIVVGNMVKDETLLPGVYEFKTFYAEFTVTADHSGKVYLVIGTDSGFEATTSYYLDDISIQCSEVAEKPTVTRGQAAQMLFHTADLPGADVKNCPFKDVDQDDPNIEAITWAQENGYLAGYGAGLFGPQDSMTMEQAMVMIHRFSGSPAADLTVLNNYKDGMQVSAWAKNAVAWAIENKIYCPGEVIAPQTPITLEVLSHCFSQIAVAYEYIY